MIVDCAHYRNGVRQHEGSMPLEEAADHVKRVAEEVDSQRELLTSILQANLALVAVRQNEVVRKISGWAAIIAVPTFIASVYGMNFDNMPELGWGGGYALVWAAMLTVAVLLLVFFKRVRWL